MYLFVESMVNQSLWLLSLPIIFFLILFSFRFKGLYSPNLYARGNKEEGKTKGSGKETEGEGAII